MITNKVKKTINDMFLFFNHILYTTDLLLNKEVEKPCYSNKILVYNQFTLLFKMYTIEMEINGLFLSDETNIKIKQICKLKNFNTKFDDFYCIIINKISYKDIDKLKELILELNSQISEE